ncbi:hypothetical protein KY290_006863 [Solanum tuberosum]|uniref:Uncharacterized protein n=1 Tax=Solanum tuberosum TaxID=4113 RepID=A0ABQ7W409_SOLTU|nr:hypothetical protein KY284_006901 [Solanum tuberosum]KAH0775452.1 hypothetical protein KY290_006863 [Solanum tuberosum]
MLLVFPESVLSHFSLASAIAIILKEEFPIPSLFPASLDWSSTDEARKALESALGGKKTEFEKWDKEIKRREEAGGGDNSGGGGWFNWRRWFGGSDDGHFWQEAQQATLAILGIIVMYLIVTKGDVMLAVIFNPLLFTLRGARNGFTFVTSQIMRKVYPASQDSFGTISPEEVPSRVSAKETVARKWGSD